MANQVINKFINSSLSLAFLTMTSIATAYCYGWGQALFHGYPWWHVEIGQSSMARSLAYILSASLILFICYVMGYLFVNKLLNIGQLKSMGWLRILILVSVFTVPILMTFYLFIGVIPLYLAVAYIGITIVSIFCFQKHWNHVSLKLDFRKMFKEEHFWFFNLFIFIYFCVLAVGIGYLRADLRQTYDYLELDGKTYYILSTNSDDSYIMAEKTKGNTDFIFFHRESQKYYTIHVTKIYHQ